MRKALMFLITGITAFNAIPASAESLKVHFSRPAVIDGKTFAAGTYYLHTPAAGETGPVWVVNAATGAEAAVPAVRTAAAPSKPQAILSRAGREDVLEAIRTRSASWEFSRASELARAE